MFWSIVSCFICGIYQKKHHSNKKIKELNKKDDGKPVLGHFTDSMFGFMYGN